MWYQIKHYLKFLKASKNQHGVHSPFVFNLITKCFYNKEKYNDYSILKNYRNSLLKNNNTINITDFGAGSRVFKSNTRKISAITKHAGISKKRAQLLYRITHYFSSENILELGTSLGLATSALALGNKNARITTIEGCPETAKIAKQQFDNFKLNNIDVQISNFEDALTQLKNTNFDLVYIDGNHNKNATLSYFETLLETVNNETIFIFDDIHWSKGMTEAWETIKQHPKVTVTIDTYFWGIVCFRKEQNKEHFKIRL